MAPICLAHACVGCTSDYTTTNPSPTSCPTPQLPACQTAGALAGECTQCSSTNASVCAGLPKQPVCVAGKEQCGCSQNSDCGAHSGLVCDASVAPAGQCVPGCTTTGGMDNCPPGEACVMGTCTTAGPDAGNDAASGSGGADAAGDGSPRDASSSGSGGSSSGSGGTMEAGSNGGSLEDGSSGGSMEGGTNADAPVSLEGGGCDLTGAPASSLVKWGALGTALGAAGVVRRRRRRGQ
jgi:hypothetical protein